METISNKTETKEIPQDTVCFRLKKVYIKGFKSEDREIHFDFSEEPATIVYGDNGCGKTTFLQVLHAVLAGDEIMLMKEHVEHLKIYYSYKIGETEEEQEEILSVTEKDLGEYEWTNEQFLQERSASLFIGMHRGLFQAKNIQDLVISGMPPLSGIAKFVSSLGRSLLDLGFAKEEYNEFTALLKHTFQELSPDTLMETKKGSKTHIYRDAVGMRTIHEQLVAYGNELERAVVKILTDTYDALVTALLLSEEFPHVRSLNEKDYALFAEHKGTILLQFSHGKEEQSGWEKKLGNIIAEDKFEQLEERGNEKTRYFFTELADKLAALDERKLKGQKLIQVFNKFLGRSKTLELNYDGAYIAQNGQKIHDLEQLSSGERNLLALLHMLVFEEKKQDFIFIDEPEVSLNIEWQRLFIPTLIALFPKTQLIIASHSPAMVSEKAYLRELL